MIASVSFETLKLRIRWMPRIIVLLLLGLIALGFWGQGTRLEDQPNLILPRGWLAGLIFASFFAPFFWPVLGGTWAGNEYGWGTIRMILTRRPYRIQHVVSSLIVLTAMVGIGLLAVEVAATAAGFLVAVLSNNSTFTTGVFDSSWPALLVKSFLAAWYVAFFYLVLAYAAATIFRSTAVGISIGIGSTLAEFVLRGIFRSLGGTWQDVADHFPVMYTNDFVTRVASSGMVPGTNMATVDSSVPSAGQSIIALTIFLVILLAATILAVRNRDVTA